MAANYKPSRIDQVFADGRLIDEALIAAAADARDRHRRAGVPLVVFRDGRIEHVPADRLVPDVDTLLMDADFEAERTARELIRPVARPPLCKPRRRDLLPQFKRERRPRL